MAMDGKWKDSLTFYFRFRCYSFSSRKSRIDERCGAHSGSGLFYRIFSRTFTYKKFFNMIHCRGQPGIHLKRLLGTR